MDDREFEAMLEETMDQTPPGDATVEQVTPWRRAMNRILWGMGLCTVTLNFWALDVILPAIGVVLSFLGFRALRRENPGFRVCYRISCARALYSAVWLILDATIWGGIAAENEIIIVVSMVMTALNLLQSLFLWAGLREVRKKAGLEPHAGSAVALFLWQLAALVLALMGGGGIFGYVMIAVYFFIIRCLYKLSKELDSAGYAIEPAPVRLPDRICVLLYTALTAVGILAGFLWFQRYPMDWQPVTRTVSAEAESVREDLLEQGFPEEVLDDLTEGEILSMEGALDVVVSIDQHALGSKRTVTEETSTGIHITYHHGPDNLTITGIAVKLPTERETWKIIQHFRWTEPPEWYGTEAIELWSAMNDGWHNAREVSGRVLCDVDGTVYTAPYWSLGWRSYTSSTPFWGESSEYNLFAAFSLNPCGEANRGYITYDIQEVDDGWIVDEWINYTHTLGPWQYPVESALEHELSGVWGIDSVFRTVQDAIQFYPNDEDPQPFS